ncbi:MAG TPA: hypothetical protein ENF20_06970, partial [Candidatus Marinimicrobia bacterium]|nr:hypothetical protein [Candidatus Neomarinimicrobiota bacterium]
MPVRIPQRMPSKWLRFQDSMKQVGSALGEREKERRAKSEALKALIMGEVIKNEFKKEQQQQQMQMIQK